MCGTDSVRTRRRACGKVEVSHGHSFSRRGFSRARDTVPDAKDEIIHDACNLAGSPSFRSGSGHNFPVLVSLGGKKHDAK